MTRVGFCPLPPCLAAGPDAVDLWLDAAEDAANDNEDPHDEVGRLMCIAMGDTRAEALDWHDDCAAISDARQARAEERARISEER